MDADDSQWLWQPGERGFNFHIPPNERLPPPPPTPNQGRGSARESDGGNGWAPDLTGCTLEQVQAEASRINVGDEFTSIKEFDRCLQSWCVLNGRISTRIKTQKRYALRVCHFGGRVRPLWRHNSNGRDQGSTGPAVAPPSTDQAVFSVIGGAPSNPGEGVARTQSEICPPIPAPVIAAFHGDASADAENHAPVAAIYTENPLLASQPIRNAVTTAARAISTPLSRRTTPASSHRSIVQRQQTALRLPLQDIDINARVFDGHNLTQQTGFIRNSRQWIPGHNGTVVGETVRRNTSQSGACGELARVVPSALNSPPEFCPWRVRLQLDRFGTYKITICQLRHTCPASGHRWRGPTHQSMWLGTTLAGRVVRNVKVPVKELIDGFQTDFMKTTTYKPMWRGRDLVKDWYLGGQRHSFHLIPSLLSRLTEVDPDSVVDWSTHDGSTIFRRAFICLSATREFLQFCQPLVSLDACHTKNRKYPSQLFLATVLDGNMKGTILCYAIAPVESTKNWLWFLELVEKSIVSIHDPTLPLISDRQKGLIAAVGDVFPDQVHAHCANHLRANVKKNFGKSAEGFFWGAVYAHTPTQ